MKRSLFCKSARYVAMWSIAMILLILILSLYYYLTRTFNYWKLRRVPGPRPVPLFGNIKESALRRKPFPIVLQEIYNEYPNEKVVGFFKMTLPCLLIRDLEIIKQVMIKDFDVFDYRGVEFSEEGYGANLFHSDGETWRPLRHVLTPMFTMRKLKDMVYLLEYQGDKLINKIDRICREQPEQCVDKLFEYYSIAAITSCAFGIDVEQLGDAMDAIHDLNNKALKVNYFQELDMMFPGILKFMTGSVFSAVAVNIFDSIIKRVMKERNGKPSGRKDFMDLILELKQKRSIKRARMYEDDKRKPLELTDSMIAAQAFLFYIAGQDTSTITMSYMVHQLALNPDMQEKLIAEVDGVLEKYNGETSFEAVSELPYMEKIFNETQRMYSIGDQIYRAANRDYKIPNTDVVVTKGQMVMVSMSGVHGDERYYPNPNKFDPERFSPESIGSRHSCAFLPFGIGPRHCIGSRFAKIHVRMGLLKFFSKFRVEATESSRRVIELDPMQITLKPLGGITLKIIPRTT